MNIGGNAVLRPGVLAFFKVLHDSHPFILQGVTKPFLFVRDCGEAQSLIFGISHMGTAGNVQNKV